MLCTLAYFALPIDLIPEAFLFGLGFPDDAAVVLATLKTLSDHVTDEHHVKAEVWLNVNT